ncbi:hypothetical protein BDK51DRAFT_26570 [Blyttiomyces helicus]|uniref:Uncharacterized protein n=1 Tax=Blyttiomyces helicus TaxID=388810 RepID=A0A4P9VWL7_9FUNG|nr:hypothetical protein BDK51DRAFT_26570 [Blyttiomyces helicus]|eukprot:RKO84101.1 hypothetical protein BDK51DRAFT_26570 [Blyttiomyces helicus]
MGDVCVQSFQPLNGDLDGEFMAYSAMAHQFNTTFAPSASSCQQQCGQACTQGYMCFWYKYTGDPRGLGRLFADSNPLAWAYPQQPSSNQCWLQTVDPQPGSTLYVRATNLTIPNATFPLAPGRNNSLVHSSEASDHCQAGCDALGINNPESCVCRPFRTASRASRRRSNPLPSSPTSEHHFPSSSIYGPAREFDVLYSAGSDHLLGPFGDVSIPHSASSGNLRSPSAAIRPVDSRNGSAFGPNLHAPRLHNFFFGDANRFDCRLHRRRDSCPCASDTAVFA